MKVVLPVVIWCVLSAIVATVAERKGHKGGLFLLISIVLSPLIGFIIVAFLTDKYKMTEARSRERRSVKQEWISKRVLELVEQGKNAADAKIQAEAEFSVRRDEIFSESENNDSPVRNGIIRPLACVAVIAIIIVCVVSLAMNSNKHSSTPNYTATIVLDDFQKTVPEIKWIIVDKNNAYVGWDPIPKDYREVCKSMALAANKATNFGFHVWAFEDSKISAGKEAIQDAINHGKFLFETTARYGKIE